MYNVKANCRLLTVLIETRDSRLETGEDQGSDLVRYTLSIFHLAHLISYAKHAGLECLTSDVDAQQLRLELLVARIVEKLGLQW